MSRRAYHPRRSTVDLLARILARPGIERAHTIAPSRGVTVGRTRIRVYTDGRDGAGAPIYTDFTLPEARAWLASEEAAR